ncbi:MAG: hypothetical protein JSS29_15605 [Proteobacteria bacterium]|nr:hypothetical protein [Pseudomonadota bacterium]
MNKKTLAVLGGLVMLCGCAVDRIDPLKIPLNFTPDPRNAAQIGSLQCGSIGQVQVTDARTDKVLGERVHESKPLKAQVTTDSDVAQWVQTGIQGVMNQNGIRLGTGPTLEVSVDSLHTLETVWHRAGYDARISMVAKIHNSAGKMCWNETVQGRGGNYGYAGNTLNYQETVNEALANATLSMLQSSTFKDALCQCAN